MLQKAVTLHQQGQIAQARLLYQEILKTQPQHFDALHLLGVTYLQAGQPATAAQMIAEAIPLNPKAFSAHSNLGNALVKLRRLDEALASFDQAIALKPDFADAHNNRGNVLKELNRLPEALASYDQATALAPGFADPHWNKAIVLLLMGDFEHGWPLYTWRWSQGQLSGQKRNFAQPLWLGKEALAGKTILLYAEQGLGDSIQFCRYAKQVAALGAKVLLEVPPQLLDLLAGLDGVSQYIEKGQSLPDFDYHCPLLSLPLAFQTRLNSIPSPQPYLRSDPVRREVWRARLGEKTRPRVGLVWSGRTTHTDDHNRSMTLTQLIAHLPPGCDYVCLHQEVRDVDKPALAQSGIRHYEDKIKDFADTAALCDLMDIVLSVDTSVAHLAGALGRPTWVLLPYAPDWRWLLDRTDSPWYASLTLYRQGEDRDWDSVLRRVATDLRAAAS